MKFEVAIVIAIVWFIIRSVRNAAKKNKANLQSGGQNSNNSANAAENFAARDTLLAQMRAIEAESERRLQERAYASQAPSIVDPFMDSPRSLEDNAMNRSPRSLEDNPYDHYNKERLVEQYVERHAEGKTVSHHKHQLFQEQKDRQKAQRHNTGAHKPASARAHQVMHAAAPTKSKRAERRIEVEHPLATALKGKEGLKQAFMLSEILKRPEF